MGNLKRCEEHDFNIDSHLVSLQFQEPFFSEIARHINKIPTLSSQCPTMMMSYNKKLDDLELYYNPEWASKLTDIQIKNVLIHELYHVIFCHLSSRFRTPQMAWNLSTDSAINSIIVNNSNCADSLPPGCIIPGRWPTHPTGRELTAQEKETEKISAFIAQLPPMLASEVYFEMFCEFAKKEGISFEPQMIKVFFSGGYGDAEAEGKNWIPTLDNHEGWASIPDDMREYIEGKIKAYIERGVQVAESHQSGWGSVPNDMREEIRRSVMNIINWKAGLKQWIGTLSRGNRTSSIKRINRRYPYIHPGSKRGYTVKLLIAVDESGSVFDQMLEEFFGVLSALTRKITVDILPFDCEVRADKLFTWTKGTNPHLVRETCGGTDFDAPTNFLNDVKNRGRWDGMIICTDGCAPEPGPSRLKRGWVLGKGCKLLWNETSETIVPMDSGEPVHGAWR
jgi:predicted metal-dependent peptidase